MAGRKYGCVPLPRRLLNRPLNRCRERIGHASNQKPDRQGPAICPLEARRIQVGLIVQSPNRGTDSRLNRQFHKLVRDAARQPTLSGFTDQLLYALVMRQYRSLTRKHPRRDALNEHRAILYALQTRNAEAASAAMRHHVASARRALLSNTAAASDAAGPDMGDEGNTQASA
jgi:DNA-binding FadR family transcriptional regulator